MRRIVFIVPDWVREDDEASLRQKLPALERLAEISQLVKLTATPPLETPEALVLGMAPSIGQLRQGPLTISALGADPPERSTHFHLSLLAHVDGLIMDSKLAVPEDDLREIMDLAVKLNTKTLTFVPGEQRNHGLVWEALPDLRTYSVLDSAGKRLKEQLPEGEGEALIRRYIDDSVNLLSELELNARRIDQELPPLNLLWPWGHGMRQPVPNLALKRGQPTWVFSESMRLEWLSRLAGYRHVERQIVKSGLQFNLKEAAKFVQLRPSSITYIETISNLQSELFGEERAWMTRQIDDLLIAPLLDLALREPVRLAILSPSREGVGLGMQFETGQMGVNHTPFDPRALEETQLPSRSWWEVVERTLS